MGWDDSLPILEQRLAVSSHSFCARGFHRIGAATMLHRPHEFLAILDPRCWIPTAQSLRTSEGWQPPMMVIAAIGVSAFSYGLLREYAVLVAFLLAVSGSCSAVGLIASIQAMADSMRNLARLRLYAWTRPRFWFEIARLSCLLGVMSMLLMFCGELVGPLQSLFLSTALLGMTLTCQAAFFVTATMGYGVMFLTGKKVSGRAIECVRCFYQYCLALFATLLWVNTTEEPLGDPQTAVVTLAVSCVAGAVVHSLLQRSQACDDESKYC